MSAAELGIGNTRAWAGVSSARLRSRFPATCLAILTSVCWPIVDVAVVFGAFSVAYWIRFIASDDEIAALGFDHYVRLALLIGLATSALFLLRGLYDASRQRSWPSRLYTIVSAVSTALVMAIAVSYVSGEPAYSRLWFAAGWSLAVAGLVTWRTIAGWVYTRVQVWLAHSRRVLIVGANVLGMQLCTSLGEGYEVVGYVDNGTDLEGPLGVPLLGPIAQLEHLVHALAVDELIITLPSHRREQIGRIIARGFHHPLTVKFLPEFGEVLSQQRLELHRVGGVSFIGFAPVAIVSPAKRALDLLLTSTGLLLMAPLLLVIALAIRLDSPGPVFFRQVRVGKNGRHFKMFKFRSMCVDAERRLAEIRDKNEATGPLFKMKADPRITRVGSFLRRWSLDELPQLFNVVLGDMSLVGPRPPIPSEVAEYEEWQLGRLRAIPGLTGLWQVSGRSEVPFYDMVRLDLHYIRNWSLALDLEILFRTVPAVLTNRGAY